MSTLSNQYRTIVINQILFATSQDEVKKLVEEVVKTVEQAPNDRDGAVFIGRVICDLELFNPLKKEVQQWSNVKLARILFNRSRVRLNAQ